MDSITQGLLGAVTAQLGFRQRIGRETTWVAAVVAIIPDLDILIHPLFSLSGSESGELDRIVTHRGISHSLLLVPLIALPVALFWRWAKNNRRPVADLNSKLPDISPTPKPNPSFALLYICTLAALLSHPLLDWCTSYGTQLFAPLTTRRYALDAIAIIDIFYTPLLILTLLACYLVRKFRKNSRTPTLWIGWIGFLLSLGYLFAGWQFHNQAIEKVKEHFTAQQAPSSSAQYHAYPQLGSIWGWRVTSQKDHKWYVAQYNLLMDPKLKKAKFATGFGADNRWVEIAKQLPEVKTFYWFALGQVRPQYEQQPNRHFIDFQDMRYSREPAGLNSLWSLRVVYDDQDHLILVDHVRHYHGKSFSALVRQAWQNIWNP